MISTMASDITYFMTTLTAMEAVHNKKFDFVAPAIYNLNTRGSKYYKITRDRSVYCFIDKENGNIYKPAGYRAPAKDARANLHDYDTWVNKIDPYGSWLYKKR